MTAPNATRRYPRVKSPKGLHVGWQSSTQKFVSSVETLGLGGMFIRTKEPPPAGTTLQLLIDIAGGGVRARAVVKNIKPGEGMGVDIVSMNPEDRARLSNFVRQLPS